VSRGSSLEALASAGLSEVVWGRQLPALLPKGIQTVGTESGFARD